MLMILGSKLRLSSSEIKIPKYFFGPTPIRIKFYSVKMETDELLVLIKE